MMISLMNLSYVIESVMQPRLVRSTDAKRFAVQLVKKEL